MSGGDDQVQAEQRARRLIDAQLEAAGWAVQDVSARNLSAGQGVAVREVQMAPGHGRADYLLYVDKKACGVIEAKPEGTTFTGVEWQSARYADGLAAEVRLASLTTDDRLPFVFEASGSETHFTNGFDPEPRARSVFSFPRPETLARILREADSTPKAATWRAKVKHLPPLETEELRDAQVTAIEGIERSLVEQRYDRSLGQMATGAGKTLAAVTQCYRLLKWGGFGRILFLVDRNNLGDQALREFQNYATPDDGRRFTALYNVDKLTGAGMVASSSVVISTIQRVYSVLRGRAVPDVDDPNLDGYTPDAPVEVAYNPDLPPEAFDLVIVDEAHRSIYGTWQGVLRYFDAHIVGLTATPVKQTFAFFQRNLVSEYTYPQSVADKVNVDFDVYRIQTDVTEHGSHIDAGTVVPKRDKRTRRERYETLEDDLTYTAAQLDKAVVNKNQIRLILETFRDRLFTDIFPGRRTVPKTLIFCKDDAHAEEVVTQVRQVFGRGNDFAAKITYSVGDASKQLQAFRNSPTLRVAVSVDMIATGTDVKPLECVFFLRDVKSASYFEQMKGRGARTIPNADFQAVTPDAAAKTRFVLVDAIGVTEHDYVDARPLERRRSVSLKQPLDRAAALTITEDEATSLASRLSKLQLELTEAERAELDQVAGQPMKEIVGGIVEATDTDHQAAALDRASESDPTATPDAVTSQLVMDAVEPIASNPDLRTRILELRTAHDVVIDIVNPDKLLHAGGVVDTDRARAVIESWSQYLEDHRDEIALIQLVQEAPQDAKITYKQLKELAERIQRPPRAWTPELLWAAYEALEPSTVRHAERHTATDLVSLVRYALGIDPELVPYASTVERNYQTWLAQQEQAGATFSDRQRWWLDRIADVIATSATLRIDDLETPPFTERGGVDGIVADLGPLVRNCIDELNRELPA